MITVVRRERSVGFSATRGAREGSHIPISTSIAASHAAGERHKVFACEEVSFLGGGCWYGASAETGTSVQGPHSSLFDANALAARRSGPRSEEASRGSPQFLSAAFSLIRPSAPRHKTIPAAPPAWMRTYARRTITTLVLRIRCIFGITA